MIETTLSRAPATPERVRHDARAVSDVCLAGPAAADSDQVIAVLRTQPAEHSGSASVAGVYFDAATGRVVDSAGAPADLTGRPSILRYEGSYVVLEVLSGPAQALSGRYAWTEPLAVRRRGLTPADVYDPFGRPGVVVCRYNPAAQGAPFDQVRLLPEGWQADVAAAQAAAEPTVPAAREWITSPNDLLFAQAASALAVAGQLSQGLVETARGQADGYRRAVLHYLTLAFARQPGQVSALEADLSGAEPDHQRAAAVGLLAARLFAPEAAAAAVSGWSRLTVPGGVAGSGVAGPGGLADLAQTAQDGYVRAAFTLLTTGSQP